MFGPFCPTGATWPGPPAQTPVLPASWPEVICKAVCGEMDASSQGAVQSPVLLSPLYGSQMTLCYLNHSSGLVFISPRRELEDSKRWLLVNGLRVVLPPSIELQPSL